MKKKKQKFTSLSVSLGLAAALVMALLFVMLFRSPDSMLPGTESYSLIRTSVDFGMNDSLSFGGRFAAYPIGARYTLSLIPEYLIPIMPFILGAISFILLMLLLKDFDIKPKRLALAVLIASPAFIFMFNTLNTASFALMLSLLGFWLFSRKSSARFFSIAVFTLIPLFDLAIGILSLALLLFYALFSLKRRKPLMAVSLAVSFAVSAAYYGYLIMNAGFERILFDLSPSGFNSLLSLFISDLGAEYGIGLFALILAVFGIISFWEFKYKNLFAFFSFTLLLVTGLFFSKAIFLLNIFIAVFAAYGFMGIYNAKWESAVFQRFVLLILACGLLFSSMSYCQRFIAEEPNAGIISGMDYLKTLPKEVVFSDYSRGSWISFAGKKNMMDENVWLAPNANERWKDSQDLFYTRDIEKAKQIIDKYNIGYIWLDSAMMQKQWKGQEEGLLFLLKYSKSSFKNIYNKQGVQVWEVVGSN